MEYFRIPRDVLVICLGKSTYARCGIIVNVTPLEPEWEGQVTIEISNTTPLPAKIHAIEGICQFLFLQGRRAAAKPATPTRPANTCASAASRCRGLLGRTTHGPYPHPRRPAALRRDRIGGAKNAALPLMAAGLLTDERLVLTNVPQLADIHTMAALLAQHGIAVDAGRQRRAHACRSAARSPTPRRPTTSCARCAPPSWCWGRCWRACGEARVSLPGGCAIGTRPVDLHLKGLEQMGAEHRASTAATSTPARRGRLHGRDHRVPVRLGRRHREPADGGDAWPTAQTVLANAAREPEIGDLADCLIAMGAQIEGIGSDRLTIEGVRAPARRQHTHHPRPHRDRHLRLRRGDHRRRGAAAAARGIEHLGAVARTLHEAGVEITEGPRAACGSAASTACTAPT